MSLIHGITATTYILPPVSAAYAFLVDHTGPDDIARTEDGETWELIPGTVVDGTNNAVNFAGCTQQGTLVLVTSNNTTDVHRVFITADGDNWALEDTGSIDNGTGNSVSCSGLAYGNGRLVACLNNGSPTSETIFSYSDDGGYTWTFSSSSPYTRSNSISYSDYYEYFYYPELGGTGLPFDNKVRRSTTGVAGTWSTMQDHAHNNAWYKVLPIDELGILILFGCLEGTTRSGRIQRSDSGANFGPDYQPITVSSGATNSGTNFAYTDGAYSPTLDIIVGVSNANGENTVVYSEDQGLTWTAIDPGFGFNGFGQVVWSSKAGRFIAGSEHNNMAYSEDGINWTQAPAMTGTMNNAEILAMISGDDIRFLP